MSWAAAFVAFLVSHMVGDFLLQTEAQAVGKAGGMADARSRRPLIVHVAVYTVAFVPALVWVATNTTAARAVAVGALIAFPHLFVDDGRLVRAWLRDVKRAPEPSAALAMAVDQSFHLVCLLGAALVATT